MLMLGSPSTFDNGLRIYAFILKRLYAEPEKYSFLCVKL